MNRIIIRHFNGFAGSTGSIHEEIYDGSNYVKGQLIKVNGQVYTVYSFEQDDYDKNIFWLNVVL